MLTFFYKFSHKLSMSTSKQWYSVFACLQVSNFLSLLSFSHFTRSARMMSLFEFLISYQAFQSHKSLKDLEGLETSDLFSSSLHPLTNNWADHESFCRDSLDDTSFLIVVTYHGHNYFLRELTIHPSWSNSSIRGMRIAIQRKFDTDLEWKMEGTSCNIVSRFHQKRLSY